jgi:hypothetical protein
MSLFERSPQAAKAVQVERATAAQAPAEPLRIENVRKEFEGAARADGNFLEGATRRGQKRSAADEPERIEENIETHARRITAETDPLKVLGLPTNATPVEVRRRYFRLSLLFHPDKNRDESAKGIWEKISTSYVQLNGSGGEGEGEGGGASAGAGGARPAAATAELNLVARQHQNEGDNNYLVRLYKIEEYYEKMIKESDETIRQLDADLAELQGEEPEVQTARRDMNKIKNDVQVERAKLGENISPVKVEIKRMSTSLRQTENAPRLLRGVPGITETAWIDMFKRRNGLTAEMSKFGKRHLTLYSFFGRYKKRHPRAHPSRVVRKFMRAMAMIV